MVKKEFVNCWVVHDNIKELKTQIARDSKNLKTNKKQNKNYCGKNLKNNLWRPGR